MLIWDDVYADILLDAFIIIKDSECDVNSDNELRSLSDLLSQRFIIRKNSRATESDSDADIEDSDISIAASLVYI